MMMLTCTYCHAQLISAQKGDVLMIQPCAGCGARQFEIQQLSLYPPQLSRQRQWLSSGSGLTLDPFIPVMEQYPPSRFGISTAPMGMEIR